MRLSIVTTLYNSATFVEEFWRRATSAAASVADDYEIVMVNDGSPDDSLLRANEVFRQDDHVKIVDLSRNFGHHKALMTGLLHADGDRIFLIDCDLEEPPELLGEFWARMEETRADVIYGVQDSRKGGIVERTAGSAFYRIFNAFSAVPVPRDAVTARLMSRRYAESLLTYQDREVFLLGLWALTGYEQIPVLIQKSKRVGTSYTIRRRTSVAVNALTSFTNTPLILVFYVGLLISAASFTAAAALVFYRVFLGTFEAGWPSVIVSVWLLGGLIILCLGVMGIYVAKIFSETKRRPYATVRAVHSHGESETK